MKVTRRKSSPKTEAKENQRKMKHYNIIYVFLFLVFVTSFYLVNSFEPLSKEEQISRNAKLTENVEPFRKNVSECARQTKSSMADVDNFFKRIPQATMQGKCFVACMLKRNLIIVNNKISGENLINANRAFYNDDAEVMTRLKSAIVECQKVIESIFEICEFASIFNDCMHMRMEHILDKITMEKRMEALGQMSENPDVWSDEDIEMLKLAKDEL